MHIYFKWNIINVIDVATKIKELDIPIIFLISHSKSPKNQKTKILVTFDYIISPMIVTN